MVRDMELVRTILLAIEQRPSINDPSKLTIPGHAPREVNYHLVLLIDAGYIQGLDVTTFASDGKEILPSRLTWAGHEFLDAARNDTVWRQAWDQVRVRGGGIAVEVFKQLLIEISKKQFLGTP